MIRGTGSSKTALTCSGVLLERISIKWLKEGLISPPSNTTRCNPETPITTPATKLPSTDGKASLAAISSKKRLNT